MRDRIRASGLIPLCHRLGKALGKASRLHGSVPSGTHLLKLPDDMRAIDFFGPPICQPCRMNDHRYEPLRAAMTSNDSNLLVSVTPQYVRTIHQRSGPKV